MDKAVNMEDLVKKVTELLQMFDHVYYDAESLSYDGVMDEWLYGYGDYLDINDGAFAEIGEDELRGWERDHVVGLRETLGLKSSIDKPASYVSFKWMEDFTQDHADNSKFFNDAVKALRNRHPFRGFRSALDWNGLTDEWYVYRDSRMEDYVRREIPELSDDFQSNNR